MIALSNAAGTKKCSKCKLVKPVAEFNKNGKKGLAARCKPCTSERRKKLYHDDPVRHRAYTHAFYRRSPKQRAALKEAQRRYKMAHREKLRIKARERYHGGDPETCEYIAILCGDPCSYCDQPMEHVDHVAARDKGGSNLWENLTAACASCNSRKHTHSLLYFLAVRR